MNSIKYITRGDSDFQGKPRAFFTSHPGDFQLYFKQISEEVLSLQNCSIWYFENQDKSGELDEEQKFSIGTMNLIVIPVTERLLTDEGSFSYKIIKAYNRRKGKSSDRQTFTVSTGNGFSGIITSRK